jgi:hypothetical protein
VKLGKTKTELLALTTSRELTEWQAYWTYLAEKEGEKTGGGRSFKWNDE